MNYGWRMMVADPETGFYYCRNRFYAPALGRFCSRDPMGVGFDGQVWFSIYNWGSGSPLNQADPLGLQADEHWHHIIPKQAYRDLADGYKYLDSMNDVANGLWVSPADHYALHAYGHYNTEAMRMLESDPTLWTDPQRFKAEMQEALKGYGNVGRPDVLAGGTEVSVKYGEWYEVRDGKKVNVKSDIIARDRAAAAAKGRMPTGGPSRAHTPCGDAPKAGAKKGWVPGWLGKAGRFLPIVGLGLNLNSVASAQTPAEKGEAIADAVLGEVPVGGWFWDAWTIYRDW